MATTAGNGKVKLNNGQVVSATNGAWLDGQQYWDGTLSSPGQFNSKNNQAGQQGGAAPVQNAQDASYLQSRGDTTATSRIVNQNPQQVQSINPGSNPGSFAGLPQGAPTINLQSIYDQAFKDAGITGLQTASDTKQAEIDAARRRVAEVASEINDNPFLSESTRTGRIGKLNSDADSKINNLTNELSVSQNKVATAKADAQVKLNIATQQYNIENQQYQQNVQLFNQLLTSGALNNISGNDVAQISASTGLSSSMIQSIIKSSQDKENKPQLVTIDDGQNQIIKALDSRGNVVNEQILGKSVTKITGGGDTANSTADIQKLYDKYDTQVQNILKEEDTSTNSRDKGDKLLSASEQERALARIMSLLGVSREVAYDILAKGFAVGGYGSFGG